MRKLLILGIGGLGVVGCMQNKDAMNSHRDPMAVAAEHDPSKFEEAKEPALSAETLFASGALAESQGQNDKAVDQYNQALKVDPNNEKVLFHLGLVYTNAKDYPKAIATWKQYVAATHQAANGYANLGFCYELSGDTAEAEGAYRLGIGRDANSQPCRVNLGVMLGKQGRADEALDQLLVVLPAAEAHYNLGSVYQEQGKFLQARNEFDLCTKLDPRMIDAKQRLASLGN